MTTCLLFCSDKGSTIKAKPSLGVTAKIYRVESSFPHLSWPVSVAQLDAPSNRAHKFKS